jgi:transcriptional regulator with PAS, ATPase and Fis domain
VKANVRVLAATNRSLTELVEKNVFRRDLFYRVNVVRLDLPPLRQRKEDIPMLVKHFIGRLNRLQGKAVAGISHEALSLLMFHDFPGNIRELENIIEHAFVLCPEGRIELQCLPESLKVTTAAQPACGRMDTTLQSTEIRVIMEALERNQYNRLITARELGMHKSTLFRKIKRFGLDLPRTDGRSQRGSVASR